MPARSARLGFDRIANLLNSSTANRWVGLPCAPRMLRARALALRLALTMLCWLLAEAASAQVELPAARPGEPIVISAERANRWRQGQYDVWLLRGNCTIHQGANRCRSRDAVLWVKQGEPLASGDADEEQTETQQKESGRHKVIAYLEGDVQIEAGRREQRQQQPLNSPGSRGWFGRFYTTSPIEFNTPQPGPEPPLKPTVFQNAMERRNPEGNAIQRTQFTVTQPDAAQAAPAETGTRRVRIFPRSSVNPQVRWIPNAARDEGVLEVTGGVAIMINGANPTDQLDIEADRVVLWTTGEFTPDMQEKFQDEDVPLEVYLEGNVVFRQGDRVVYANRMFYDVNKENGTIVEAEIFTPAPGYAGRLRLKSQLIKVTNGDNFYARNSFVTSSGLGQPRYRIQTGEIFVEDHQRPVVNPFTGMPVLDPANPTEQVIEHEQLVTSKNNFLFLGPVPIFYWPRFSTNLDEPSTLITSAYFQNDKIFGNWEEVEIDAFQLLGIRNVPQGLDLTFTVSNVSKRGFGGGTDLLFDRPNFLGLGNITSNLDVWGLHDKGFDNLGRTRTHLTPESRNRGRVLETFRQQMPSNFQLTGELGWISDRNFLEQYYEAEWDQHKDETTDLELKRIVDNRSWSVFTSARLNPFFTETQWLPRYDHHMLGQPLLGDRLTWYEHSNLGYAQYKITNRPTDPADAAIFQYLPWEQNTAGMPSNFQGEQLVTRQEVDAPFDLGPFKFSPYAMGELARWGEDLSGNPLNRAWGQAGLRGSIAFWASNPTIESQLLNVHGLAHKMVFEFDASASDTNKRMTSLPLYDALDDNSQEHFRRRFGILDYGGNTPFKFDPRSYALRMGLQNYVSAPVSQVADRLDAVRFGLRQRWQTKRGPANNRRIIDWILLDTNAVYFPNPNRDNFGQAFGLVNYDFRWHVGDRVTLTSDGGYDFFSQGQRTFAVGATLQQPPRLNWNVAFRSLNGPFTYNVVTISNSYMLSPKWMYTAGTSFALNASNIGQNIGVTRIGESFVSSLALYVDTSKSNFGFNFMVSPRFLGPQLLRRIGGANIPMSNQYGLE